MTDGEAAHVSLPFAPAPAVVFAAAGETLRTVLTRAIRDGALPLECLPLTVVYRNGVAVAREDTLATVVEAGDQLNVVVEPEGGGGRGGKDIGRALFQIAVIAAATMIGGPLGSALASAGVSASVASAIVAVAQLAVLAGGNALAAELFAPESAGGASGDRYALQNASNQYRPWQAMPLALGPCVVAPDLAVKTFTRSVGEDTWIFGILGLHYGACATSGHRIGDTAVTSLSADEFQMVEHLTPGPRTFSLYPNDTDQLNLTEELNKDGVTAVVRAAGADGESFELDFFLPEGLHFAKDDGRVETATVTVTVRIRPIDDLGEPAGAWEAAGGFTLSNRTREPVRHTWTVARPLGSYEFEVLRNIPDDDNEKRHDMIVLTAIRAIAFRKPVTDEILSLIEFKVKATAVNQGTLAPITCRIEPVCETWGPVAPAGVYLTEREDETTNAFVVTPLEDLPNNTGEGYSIRVELTQTPGEGGLMVKVDGINPGEFLQIRAADDIAQVDTAALAGALAIDITRGASGQFKLVDTIFDPYHAWGDPQPTGNPAALTRWLVTGPAPAKPMTPDQADDGLTEWSELCDRYDWTAGVYLTESKSQREALQLLESAGRASLWWDGSRMVAACWAERPAPKQLFTGRNLRDRSGSIVYPEPVHALRVEFANIDERGDPDEVYVYAEGFGEVADPEAGIAAASRVEAFRLEGQRTIGRAYRDGVWELTRRRLQRRVETWTTDVEHLACSFGERVLLSWRAVGEGLGEARVQARRITGGLVTGLRLDQSVEMVDGEEYAADLRFAGRVERGVDLVTVEGQSREIIFATPREPEDCPGPGDLLAWGLAGTVSSDLEIVGIEPGEDLTARLTARKYVAPLLVAAEQAALPALTSRLSGDRRRRPPAPNLLGAQGSATGVRVSFSLDPWNGSPITAIVVRWRVTPEEGGNGGWADLPQLAPTARTVTTPPPRLLPAIEGGDADATVDVELRAVTEVGQVSEPLVVAGVLIRQDPGDPTPVGEGGVRTPVRRSLTYSTEPGSSPATEIDVPAQTVFFADGTSTALPAATVAGLEESTTYGVFWRADEGYTVEESPAPIRTATGRRIFVGWHTTPDALGAYPTPPTPPPGSGGTGDTPHYVEP